jgi:hypothetical protein
VKHSVIAQLVKWLVLKGALNVIGLFRVAGASQNVRKLYRSFEGGEGERERKKREGEIE